LVLIVIGLVAIVNHDKSGDKDGKKKCGRSPKTYDGNQALCPTEYR